MMESQEQGRRVTMADIAREADVTAATVSMALRNDRRISAATRQRVQKTAQRLGYRPNPLVSALMARLHGNRTAGEPPTLAYINPTRITPHRDNFMTMQRYWNGVVARATELGYRVEEFWLFEPGTTPDRLSKILAARGTVGVIIAAPDPEVTEVRLDWEHFAVASIDHALSYPDVHWASTNHYQGMWLAIENLERHGYRRIGLVMSRDVDVRVNHTWVSALGGYHLLRPRVKRVPPLLVDDWSAWNPATFRDWIERHRPDVLIASEADLHLRVAEAGLRIPDDIGLAHLARDCASIPCAGIDQNSEQVGAVAVDLVVDQMHRNERGIPATVRCVMIEGSWVDGPTLASQRPVLSAMR